MVKQRVTRRVVAWLALALAPALALGVACSSEDHSVAPPTAPVEAVEEQSTTTLRPDCADAATCTTRQLADSAGVALGAAVTVAYLDETEYRATLVETFNSITPENELKWDSIQPEPGEWNFGPADVLVAFADEHDLEVKGHTLIWHQEFVHSTPDWVLEIDDPEQLRSVITEHITTVMQRYADSVDRWDVVNEPLETLGSGLHDNHFRRVLGDDYVGEMFRIAHDAAPDTELWLNEAAVEFHPAKAAALVSLVASLLEMGTPIHGVGIQGHLIGGKVDAEFLEQLVADLEGLGVKVAITELDVPAVDPVDPLEVQADTYRDAIGACLINLCREVTLWGFTDRYTWIDTTFGEGLAPLPFDSDYQPKPALESIREELSTASGSN